MISLNIKGRKTIVCIAMAIVMVVGIIIPLSFNASAEMVDVYNDINPNLVMENIAGKSAEYGAYTPNGEILSQENGKYKMNTNSYVFWFDQDNISFAYKKSKFNTGKGSVMTLRTTITSWTGNEAGITVRESLDPSAPAVLISYRPGGSYLIYRKISGQAEPEYKHNDLTTNFGTDKMHLKMVIEKTTGRITGYYKIGGDVNSDDSWIVVAQATMSFLKNSSTLYTGISLGTSNKNKTGVLELNGLSIKLQAPEGYTEESDSSDSSGGSTPTEPEITLPADQPPQGDALLYETFTDGSLFDGEESVTNPLWTVRAGTPLIELNSDKTNRYLACYPADDKLMITAGDMAWTDYRTQMDFVFNKDSILSDTNGIAMNLRHRSVVVGGTSEYQVKIMNKSTGSNTGQFLQLCWKSKSNNFLSNPVVIKEVKISDTMIEKGITHKLCVDVIDTTFNIYLDDQCLITFTDTFEHSSNVAGGDPVLTGCVGITVDNAYVQIDNFLVRKLFDPLGGDYDNQIQGNYDQPVPDYLSNYYGIK